MFGDGVCLIGEDLFVCFVFVGVMEDDVLIVYLLRFYLYLIVIVVMVGDFIVLYSDFGVKWCFKISYVKV